MFADLPKALQEKVLEYLQENNFPAAKALHDEYHRQQAEQSHHSVINRSKHSKSGERERSQERGQH